MREDPARTVPDDEIDFGRLGRRIWRLATYPFRLLAAHPFITGLFIIAAVALAVLSKYTVPRSFDGTFVIRPVDKNERFHLHMLDDLNRMLKQKDYQAVGRALGISMSEAGDLWGLQAHNPFLSNRSDSVNYTVITIKSSSPEKLEKLQNGILGYLEKNPYFTKIRRLQEAQLELQKKSFTTDIARLDSLKVAQLHSYRRGATGGAVLLSELIDPSKVYTTSAERVNRLVGLMAQEKFLDNFQLVKPVVPPRIHSFPPRILVMCLYYVPVALLICFLVLAARDYASRARS